MLLGVLTEVIWEFFQQGRAKATSITFSKKDIAQRAKMSVGAICRNQYYASKKNDDYGRPDYSFISPMLSVKRFTLIEDNNDRRIVDMSDFDVFRLPYRAHLSLSPIGEGCGKTVVDEITILAQPGEEKFYQGPDFREFMFGVERGRSIILYNVPPCIKQVDVQTTIDSEDVDIPLEICYEVANLLMSEILGVPEYLNKDVDSPMTHLQRNIRQRQYPLPEVQ